MTREKLLGAFGEAAAAEYLRKHGFRILGMNYRCRGGELDVIAQEGKTVVFVEVKLRQEGGYAPAAEYVTPVKQRRLRLAAAAWLADADREDSDCRFDVMEIYLAPGATKIWRIEHLRDAF